MNPIIFCLGLLIQVPQDYPTIMGAIEASHAGDTFLVHLGTYPEQIWMPSHDILLVSDFYFTGDSSAIHNTIIDATAWAEEDTASAVVILGGSTRATIFAGFTVTGGHGVVLDSPWNTIGGAFYIRDSNPLISSNIIRDNQAFGSAAAYAWDASPVISRNLIYGNRGYFGPIGLGSCGSSEAPVIIEANNIAENPGLPEDPLSTVSPCLAASYSHVIIRSNYFHDYQGCFTLGVFLSHSHGELSSNVFENIHYRHCPGAQDAGRIVTVSLSDVDVLNNLFRNCSTFEGNCLLLNECDIYGPVPKVEGNTFEDAHIPARAALLILNTNAMVSGNNFIRCRGGGALGISIWGEFPPRVVLVDSNEFISNDYSELVGIHQASAVFVGTDGARCVLRGNSFIDNQKIAVDLLYYGSDSLTYYLDADSNYWSDSTGPYHAELNPTGRGDTVAGRVDFDPWLLEPPAGSDGRPSSPIPQTFALLDPYPNPFNPGVMLPLEIHRPGIFKVEIFDLLGRRVWSKTERCSVGAYRVYWPGIASDGHAAAGIYFARASSGREVSPTRKLVLLK